ncbi:hypothetical protein BDZ89DRAFT_1138832 [Hymenopellis radicata]|nr:hypothetical protein BDZ89DRAFT_1138832 [Hymenopellis radicata]
MPFLLRFGYALAAAPSNTVRGAFWCSSARRHQFDAYSRRVSPLDEAATLLEGVDRLGAARFAPVSRLWARLDVRSSIRRRQFNDAYQQTQAHSCGNHEQDNDDDERDYDNNEQDDNSFDKEMIQIMGIVDACSPIRVYN